MDARFLVLVLAAFAIPVQAQYVYKCRQRGQVVYQSEPCVAVTPEKVWEAAPVPEQSNSEQWRLYRIRKQLDRRYAADRSADSAAYVSSSQSGNSCESAKRARAAVYEATGVHRDFVLSSQWDNAVHDACK